MAATVTLTETYIVAGTYSWICPAGVTTVEIECWAGGAGGQASNTSITLGGTAGGGGEYAAEPSNTVTPGNSYTVVVGAGGTGGSGTEGAGGTNGGNSTFSGTGTTTVTAHGGESDLIHPDGIGAGGRGSTNTIHYNGGNGGLTAQKGGGGGGSGAGTSSVGNSGALGAPTLGGAGGTAPVGGGAGGNGGTAGACVTADTKIYTRRGWLAYDEIIPQDEALTINVDTDDVEWSPVLRVNVHPGSWEMYEVIGNGLSVCVNAEHRWLVDAGGVWKYRVLRELQPDDLIPLGDGLLRFGDCTITPLTVDGSIWCPTTGNGNWLAARNGFAYFIGNKP